MGRVLSMAKLAAELTTGCSGRKAASKMSHAPRHALATEHAMMSAISISRCIAAMRNGAERTNAIWARGQPRASTCVCPSTASMVVRRWRDTEFPGETPSPANPEAFVGFVGCLASSTLSVTEDGWTSAFIVGVIDKMRECPMNVTCRAPAGLTTQKRHTVAGVQFAATWGDH